MMLEKEDIATSTPVYGDRHLYTRRSYTWPMCTTTLHPMPLCIKGGRIYTHTNTFWCVFYAPQYISPALSSLEKKSVNIQTNNTHKQ